MEKTYVVGFVNFFDNELKLEIVQASSEFEAAKDYLKLDDLTSKTVEELKEELINQDCLIEVKEIT